MDVSAGASVVAPDMLKNGPNSWASAGTGAGALQAQTSDRPPSRKRTRERPAGSQRAPTMGVSAGAGAGVADVFEKGLHSSLEVGVDVPLKSISSSPVSSSPKRAKPNKVPLYYSPPSDDDDCCFETNEQTND